MTSNIAESLNSWLLEAREKPVLPMFEQLRKQLMKWYMERRVKENETTGLLVKDVASKIMVRFSLIRLTKVSCNTRARRYRILESEPLVEYEIESKHTGRGYIVRFDQQTCTCRKWQLKGYPCAHGLAVILTMKEDPQLFAKSFFRLDAYHATYENHIYAPNSHENVGPSEYRPRQAEVAAEDSEDSDNGLLPPTTRRGPRAPKKRRIRTQIEIDQDAEPISKRLFRCGRCGGVGHSRRTCNEVIRN